MRFAVPSCSFSKFLQSEVRDSFDEEAEMAAAMAQMKKHGLDKTSYLAPPACLHDGQGQKAHDGEEAKLPTPGQTPIKSPDTKKARVIDPETVPEAETLKDQVKSPACQNLAKKFCDAAEDRQCTPPSAPCFQWGMCCW